MKDIDKMQIQNDGVPHKKYQHYKTKQFYEIVGSARHTETNEELVVYKALYGDNQMWVRPKEVFFGTVFYNGQKIPRFK
ncbi:MAG: hypothetical protein ACD_21C00239G0001 [uncultured bacterium]|nr:MAG: hypothetical protein ACD_21C00239G0001 [uncultured bacterium]